MNQIADEVRTFIIDNFMFGQGGEDLQSDDSLMEKGIIDSTGVLELVGFLERNYGLQVEDEELIPDNLDSIANISRYVESKVKGAEAAEQ
jgi:acyl carrier protein